MSVDKEGFIPRYLYENVEGNYYDVSTEVALLHQLLEEAMSMIVFCSGGIINNSTQEWIDKVESLT